MGKMSLRTVVIVTAAVLLLAAPLAAEVYTVTLTNGNSFETRYQPEISSWDENTVVLMTTMGNWMSVEKDQVADVTSETEAAGFGRVIDDTTIELGTTANDQPSEGGEQADPQARLLQLLEAQAAAQGDRPVYNTQQFVEPSAASGIPVGYTQQVTPPMGGAPTPQPEPINP